MNRARSKPRRTLTALALVAVPAALALPAGAGAKTFHVNLTADPKPNGCSKKQCSLREAVISANKRPGADEIELPGSAPYRLFRPSTSEDLAANGDLDIRGPVRIYHPAPGIATIKGRGLDRVFDIFPGSGTSFLRIRIKGGRNPSGPIARGGGINSRSGVKLTRSIVGRNDAPAGGGGINMIGARLTLVRSRVLSNTTAGDGGGVALVGNGGRVRVLRSNVAGNGAVGRGGGISIRNAISSQLAKSNVSNNSASVGGGLAATASGLAIAASTVAENRASASGGGISLAGGATSIKNSTVAKNGTPGRGGGIEASSPANLSINASTIARNAADKNRSGGETGGGIYHGGGGPVEVRNSLLVRNFRAGSPNECGGATVTSLGHNMLTSTTGCVAFASIGDFSTNTPRIGPLHRNGGPTRTIALLEQSPARGAGGSTTPRRDQRGRKRGAKRDIGAYEFIVRRDAGSGL